MGGFEQLILQALEENKDKLGQGKSADAILKMLVEIRESAKANDQYEAYERITDELEKIGIRLREETRVTARLTKD